MQHQGLSLRDRVWVLRSANTRCVPVLPADTMTYRVNEQQRAQVLVTTAAGQQSLDHTSVKVLIPHCTNDQTQRIWRNNSLLQLPALTGI